MCTICPTAVHPPRLAIVALQPIQSLARPGVRILFREHQSALIAPVLIAPRFVINAPR
jgi:hypothetical protein